MSKEKKEENSKHDEFRLENSVYYTEVPEWFKNRKPYKPLNEKELKAPIPGTIVEIVVKQGQKVEIGDQILILEAMKMRNKINSAIDGEIKSIKVKIGDIVRKGTMLVEYK